MDFMVSDLLTIDLKWNKVRVEKFLPELLGKFLSFHPSRSRVEDRFFWQPLPTWIYSTRSGYFSASKKNQQQIISTDDSFNWTRDVWRSNCSSKLRLYIWSIINNAIPLGESLQKKEFYELQTVLDGTKRRQRCISILPALLQWRCGSTCRSKTQFT